tara:strand:- start:102 stop:482 length:381 start_codon:yes stop_codon:yes gene_type:complete
MAYTRRKKNRSKRVKRAGAAATKKVSGSSLEKKLKRAENKVETARKSVVTAEKNLTKATEKLHKFNESLSKYQSAVSNAESKLSLATDKLSTALQDVQKINDELGEYRQQRHFSPKMQRISRAHSL